MTRRLRDLNLRLVQAPAVANEEKHMAINPHDDTMQAVTPVGPGPIAELVHLPSGTRTGERHLPTDGDLAGGAVQRMLACRGHRETNREEPVAGHGRLAHRHGGGVWVSNAMRGPANAGAAAGNAAAGA